MPKESAAPFLRTWFQREDGDRMFLRNVSVQLTSETVAHPETQNRKNHTKIRDISNKNSRHLAENYVRNISSSQGPTQNHLYATSAIRKASTQKTLYTTSVQRKVSTQKYLNQILTHCKVSLRRNLWRQHQLIWRPPRRISQESSDLVIYCV
jgi:hypothetical protein